MGASGGSDLLETVRRQSASVVATARSVRILRSAPPYEPGVSGLDPDVHLLDAPAEERARYILVVDAINFGSGWFHTLESDAELDVTSAMSRRLTEHARRRGAVWSAAELRTVDAPDVATVLGQDPGHELMALYARALRELGDWLGDRSALAAVAAARGSAARFAADLAAGMPSFRDPGFYKRAQITANDLALAGVARFGDIDRLTVFADNALPHVLRVDGVLEYDDALASRVDAGLEIAAGSAAEREIRACTIHACETIAADLGVPPRTLDNWLWNRAQHPPYVHGRAHRTRTVAY